MSDAEREPEHYVPYAPVYASPFAEVDPSATTDEEIPAEELERVPPPDADDRDVVQFAGGAIEFPVPDGWIVTEATIGRQVRLYVATAAGADAVADSGRVWLTYHVADYDEKSQPEQIRSISTWWRNSLPEHAQTTNAQHANVADQPAVREDCRFTRGDEHDAIALMRGVHLLVPAKWGVVEIYAQHRADDELAWAKTTELLAGLKIESPKKQDGAVDESLGRAARVVGVWKGERSRMVITGKQDIHLEHDLPQPRRIGSQSSRTTTPPRRLSGRFEAHDDVLHITWQDGSRLNLRWRLVDGRLLLTDHLGRVSQLHRLLE